MRFTLALIVAAGAAPVFAADPRAAAEVSLTLELTAMTPFDPHDPQGEIVCVVRNDTDSPLTLPGEYDGGQIVLHGGGLTLHRQRERGEKLGIEKSIVVAPLSDAVLFRLPLGEILLPAERVAAAPPLWYWTWMKRPSPPRSPVFQHRNEGYVDAVALYVVMRRGESSVRSPPVTIKLRPIVRALESSVDSLK